MNYIAATLLAVVAEAIWQDYADRSAFLSTDKQDELGNAWSQMIRAAKSYGWEPSTYPRNYGR